MKTGSLAVIAVQYAVASQRAITALPACFTSTVFAYLAYICISLFAFFIAGKALKSIFGFILIVYHTSSNNKASNRTLDSYLVVKKYLPVCEKNVCNQKQGVNITKLLFRAVVPYYIKFKILYKSNKCDV